MGLQQKPIGKKPEVAGSGVARETAAPAPDRQQGPVYESINPTFHWSRQLGSHVLHLDLPGFKKDDLRVQVDNSGKLSVRGRSQVREGKYSRFDQLFDVPKGCDVDLITGSFDNGRLAITMPEFHAKPEEQKPKPQSRTNVDEEKGSANGSTKVTPSREVSRLENQMQKRAKTADESVQRQRWEWVESGVWREELAQAAESLREKINQNKKVIAVAFMAFSVGFCVSRKLKS